MASRVIDVEFQFNGVKASAVQALQWPRAECTDPDGAESSDLAGMLPSDAVPSAVVKATWTDTTGTKYSKTDKRPVLSYLVQSLLAKYGVSVRRGSSMVKLVRG